MLNHGAPQFAGLSAHPLQLPEVLWQGLSERQQATYELAQRILERMLVVERSGGSLTSQVGADIEGLATPEHLASAVRLLGRFGLISVEHEGARVRLGLLATPEEHIRVRHPSGGHRWVFVARPVREPQVNRHELN